MRNYKQKIPSRMRYINIFKNCNDPMYNIVYKKVI